MVLVRGVRGVLPSMDIESAPSPADRAADGEHRPRHLGTNGDPEDAMRGMERDYERWLDYCMRGG